MPPHQRQRSPLNLKVAARGSQAKVFSFARPEISIGRSNQNDLMLPHTSVSVVHSRLLARDGRYVLLDLKSEGGTNVNGRRITQPIIVRETDIVEVGAYVIEVLHREPAGVAE